MIETKKISRAKFICHSNGIVLKVLNQNRSRKSPSPSAAAPAPTEASMINMETEMTKTKTKTNRNAEQRVKQLKRVDRQHYSHVHHWPPQQQYKSKSWTIAIILKLTFVAWDSCVSNWILILSSFITRDIRRVSLVVLLLRSTTWLFFTHILTHTIQNTFLIL